jgi:hypothetical protein
MSTGLNDNLPDTLKSVQTRPLFVMRLDVRKLQIVGPSRELIVASEPCLEVRSRARGCPARCWMAAATGRQCAMTEPRHWMSG